LTLGLFVTHLEEIQTRIATKGIRANDIKHKDVLSIEQIQDIPIDCVYMWVRTGDWKQKDFNRWLKALRVME
jgi:hypothetical protein